MISPQINSIGILALSCCFGSKNILKSLQNIKCNTRINVDDQQHPHFAFFFIYVLFKTSLTEKTSNMCDNFQQ